MDLKTLLDEHKGARRLVLAVCMVWVSAAIGVGLWHLLDLTGHAVTFLLAVLGLLNVPVAWYFHQRGKE